MNPGPRPCKAILAEALSELADREARLAKLGAELAETRTAIKALRKLVGERGTATASPGEGERADRPRSEPGKLKAAAIEAVRTSFDPLTKREIAERLGRSAQGLSYALSAAVRQGSLELIGGDRYGMPSPLAPNPEDEMLTAGIAT